MCVDRELLCVCDKTAFDKRKGKFATRIPLVVTHNLWQKLRGVRAAIYRVSRPNRRKFIPKTSSCKFEYISQYLCGESELSSFAGDESVKSSVGLKSVRFRGNASDSECVQAGADTLNAFSWQIPFLELDREPR